EGRLFLVCGCKGRYFFLSHQIFSRKNFQREIFAKIRITAETTKQYAVKHTFNTSEKHTEKQEKKLS
ncbi:hypothetical protein QUW02_08750, partial [Bacteroides eggerthii]|nr:hypothetical protein [Bacteroides eggerthii]